MNIDVLFINNKLENFEEYFDENQFKEYCDTPVSYTHLTLPTTLTV